MKQIEQLTGDYLLSLLFESMTSDKMIETIDSLGLEQPVLDEQYEMDREVVILDKNHGLSFNFREIKECSQSGEPCLYRLSFEKSYQGSLPFGISAPDDYQQVKEKIGRKADFRDEEIATNVRIWIIETEQGKQYTFNVFFIDEDNLEGIHSITAMPYDPDFDNEDNYTVCEE